MVLSLLKTNNTNCNFQKEMRISVINIMCSEALIREYLMPVHPGGGGGWGLYPRKYQMDWYNKVKCDSKENAPESKVILQNSGHTFCRIQERLLIKHQTSFQNKIC